MGYGARILCIFMLFTFMIAWPLWDFYTPLTIDLDRNPYLWNETTKKINPARELTNYELFTNVTEDLLEETSPIERLKQKIYLDNLLQTFGVYHKYSNKEDEKISGKPAVASWKCLYHLRTILDLIKMNANYRFSKGIENHELAKYMDSFGRPESGLSSGAVWWVGSYQDCIASRLKIKITRPIEIINMRYCWTYWKFNQWMNKSVNVSNEPKFSEQSLSTEIRVGACIPETCDTSSIVGEAGSNLEKIIINEWPELFKENLKLVSVFCLPDERSPLRKMPTYGRIYIAFVGCWCSLLVLSSIVRRLLVARSKDASILETTFHGRILKAISVSNAFDTFKSSPFYVDYKNLKPDQYPRVDLGILNSQKIFMHLLVILGHTGYLMLAYHHSIDPIMQIASGPIGNTLMSFTRLVDTFFIISGVFAGFQLSQAMSKLNLWTIWLKFNLKLAMKILPIYYLIYLYVRFVSQYMMAGPWHDYGVYKWSPKGVCSRGEWWQSTPYIFSFYNVAGFCIPTVWFLAVYLQSGLIIPVIVWLLNKINSEKARIALVTFVSIMSTMQFNGRLLRQSSVKLEAFSNYGALIVNLLGKFQVIAAYMTFDQLGLITSGLYVGYLLQKYNTKHIKDWPNLFRDNIFALVMLLMHPIVLFAPVFGLGAIQASGVKMNLSMVIIGNVGLKLAWSILNGLLIILCATIYKHTNVVRFFSHSFWHIVNRLGLCLFLIHWEVLTLEYTIDDKAPAFGTKFEIVRKFLSSLAISLLLALPIHVLFESPSGQLLNELQQQCKRIFSSGRKKSH